MAEIKIQVPNGEGISVDDGSLLGTKWIEADEENRKISLDEVFSLLSSQRRRFILRYFSEVQENSTITNIAEQIAAWELDKDPSEVTAKERKKVYVSLYHCHLKRLTRNDVCKFESSEGTVKVGKNADEMFKYLRFAMGEQFRK